jgi:hypothetical protein
MSISEGNPDSGLRVVLTLEGAASPNGHARYVGEARTKSEQRALVVSVGDGDAVAVEIEGGNEDLAERVRLLVRAAVRHARADGRPLPRSIQRWRP